MRYYARKNAANTPRRINDADIKIIDYIMDSYSEKKPESSLFELPKYCTG